MKRLVYAMSDGSVHVTLPGPARPEEAEPVWLDRVARKCCPEGGKLVAVVNAEDLPSREHRDAWVWDGQRVVVVESRIKPKRAMQPVAEGAELGQALSQQVTDAIRAMQQALDERLAALENDLRRAVVVEHQRAIEALTVHSALEEGRAIEPGNFPALERLLAEAGQTVTSDAIIAAADAQARRGVEMAAGRV